LKGIGNGKASSVIYACEVGNQQKCREINKRGGIGAVLILMKKY
jgi:hypothetical protein